MGKLRIYTKTDGITTSSLKVESHQRRIVKPVPRGKYWGQNTMYVNPCKVHDIYTATVPVETFMFDREVAGGISLGFRRYCVLCWNWVDNPESLRTDFDEDKIRPDKGDVGKPLDIEI